MLSRSVFISAAFIASILSTQSSAIEIRSAGNKMADNLEIDSYFAQLESEAHKMKRPKISMGEDNDDEKSSSEGGGGGHKKKSTKPKVEPVDDDHDDTISSAPVG